MNATEIVGPPGRDWLYNHFNPLLIGLVLEHARDIPVPQHLPTRLWQPLGAEFDASWRLDAKTSRFEKMESGFNAALVDHVRFGLLFLHGDECGTRVASSDWVRSATDAEATMDRAGLYQCFWGFDDQRPGRIYALGSLGQYIYVAPDADADILRNGRDSGVDNDSWLATFRSMGRWSGEVAVMAVAPALTGTTRPPRVGSTALAVATLRDLGMPWAEIDAIVQTHDPRLVRRYLQLHAERLEERVAEQRALLQNIEPILVPGSAHPHARANEFPDPMGSDRVLDHLDRNRSVVVDVDAHTVPTRREERSMMDERFLNAYRNASTAPSPDLPADLANFLLTVDPVLADAAELARVLARAHQGAATQLIGEGWTYARKYFSLSEKYAAWADYDAPAKGLGIHAHAHTVNEPIRLTDEQLRSHPEWRNFGDELERHPPMRGWLAVPLIGSDGANYGFIQASDRLEGDFTEQDEANLVRLASLTSVALDALAQLHLPEYRKKVGGGSSVP